MSTSACRLTAILFAAFAACCNPDAMLPEAASVPDGHVSQKQFDDWQGSYFSLLEEVQSAKAEMREEELEADTVALDSSWQERLKVAEKKAAEARSVMLAERENAVNASSNMDAKEAFYRADGNWARLRPSEEPGHRVYEHAVRARAEFWTDASGWGRAQFT